MAQPYIYSNSRLEAEYSVSMFGIYESAQKSAVDLEVLTKQDFKVFFSNGGCLKWKHEH